MKKRKKSTPQKVKKTPFIDTGYTFREKKQRIEFRCSENFKNLLEEISKQDSLSYSQRSTSAIIVSSVVKYALEKKLIKEEDKYYLGE